MQSPYTAIDAADCPARRTALVGLAAELLKGYNTA